MDIPLNLTVAVFPSLELSFLDNNCTRGDYRGTIPVISWTARNYTGPVTLQLTLKQMGRVRFGIAAIGVLRRTICGVESKHVPSTLSNNE